MTAKEKNDLISHLYNTQHKWLLACAYNLTKNYDDAEEIVQQLYLQLLEMDNLDKIIYQGDSLNQYYIYKIIKSLFIKSTKVESHSTITPVIEDTLVGDDYMEEDGGINHRVQGYIHDALESAGWFNKRLWEVYCNEKHSIVSLHKATKISTSTIWSSQQQLKKFIKLYVQQKLKQNE